MSIITRLIGLCTNVCIDLVIFYLEYPLLLVWRACTPMLVHKPVRRVIMAVLTLWYFTWNIHYYSYDGLVHQCLYWPCDILPGMSIIIRLTGLCTNVCIDLVIFYQEYPLLLVWRACTPMSVLTLWYFTRNIYYYPSDGLVHQSLYWPCDILPVIAIITRLTGLCTNVCIDLVIFYLEYLLLLVWRACAPMCVWPCDILPRISIITRMTGSCTNVCIGLVIFYQEYLLLLVWRACAPMSVLTLWYFTWNICYYSSDGLVHQCVFGLVTFYQSMITRMTGLYTNVCIDLVIFYQEYLLLLVWRACAPRSVLILWYFTWNIHYYSYDGLVAPMSVLTLRYFTRNIHYYSSDGLVHQCLYWSCDILPGIPIITRMTGLYTNVCIDLVIFYLEYLLLLVWRACAPMCVWPCDILPIHYYSYDGLVHQCLYWPCDILPGISIITRLTGLCTKVCTDLVIFYLEYPLLLAWRACAPMSVLTLRYFTRNIHYYSSDGFVHQCLYWSCDILPGIPIITRMTGLYTNVCIDLVIFYLEYRLLLVWRACAPMSVLTLWYFTWNIHYYSSDGLVHQCLYWPCDILPGISIITRLTGLCTNVCIDLVIFYLEYPLLLVWRACAPMSVLILWYMYFTWNTHYYSSDGLVHQCLYWPCDILPGMSIITCLTGLCTNVCIDLVIFYLEYLLLLVWRACAPMSVLTLWYFTRNIHYYSSGGLVHQCLFWRTCDILPGISIITRLTDLCTNVCIDLFILSIK